MKVALAQAKQGRLHILGEMASALTAPRPELSDFAPRLITIKIHPDKIREVIGKGGSVIQAITKETGTQIDIQDDGTIVIASANAIAAQAAKARIEQITTASTPKPRPRARRTSPGCSKAARARPSSPPTTSAPTPNRSAPNSPCTTPCSAPTATAAATPAPTCAGISRSTATTSPKPRSEEHTSELQVTNAHLVCRLLLEK